MNLQKYYDSSWYNFALRAMKEVGLLSPGKVIYDVGAGNSVLKDKIIEKGSQWIGFDYNPRNEEIKEWDLNNPLNNNDVAKPDCILLLEVIEHLINPGLGIKNLSSAAKKGTYLILTTPNPYWSVIRIKFFLLGIFPMFEKTDLLNNHHVFTAWPHTIEYLLKENGFEITDTYTIDTKAKFPHLTFSPIFFIKFFYYLLRKAIEKRDVRSKGMSYGIIARKR
jgi:2-polyprenyl-3-methyl-5-hydroxy-6-metoxy-1,4-benzoquinol methylase